MDAGIDQENAGKLILRLVPKHYMRVRFPTTITFSVPLLMLLLGPYRAVVTLSTIIYSAFYDGYAAHFPGITPNALNRDSNVIGRTKLIESLMSSSKASKAIACTFCIMR